MSKLEPSDKESYDVIVLGGGAAGLMCSITAAKRGHRVLLIEVSNKLGKKILMSGGGRCNFTNLEISADNFICDNPHFVKSALSQYTQWDFIEMVKQYGIPYHEKEYGQLFCDDSAKDILRMLTDECSAAGVEIRLQCEITSVVAEEAYTLELASETLTTKNLVIATGGLSIPTLGGATGFAYQLARQFGLTVNNTEASLVPLTLTGENHELSQSLSGLSLPVVASVPARGFAASMLFTHRGLSGPAILQLSNYWYLGEPITIDLLPGTDAAQLLVSAKQSSPNSTVSACLAKHMPKALALALAERGQGAEGRDEPLQSYKNNELVAIGESINNWQLIPSGTEGYRTAEVTRGGVAINLISSKTMEVKTHPGLYFIGEALDVTGHLGGYNFQWAWSSGYVAGMSI